MKKNLLLFLLGILFLGHSYASIDTTFLENNLSQDNSSQNTLGFSYEDAKITILSSKLPDTIKTSIEKYFNEIENDKFGFGLDEQKKTMFENIVNNINLSIIQKLNFGENTTGISEEEYNNVILPNICLIALFDGINLNICNQFNKNIYYEGRYETTKNESSIIKDIISLLLTVLPLVFIGFLIYKTKRSDKKRMAFIQRIIYLYLIIDIIIIIIGNIKGSNIGYSAGLGGMGMGTLFGFWINRNWTRESPELKSLNLLKKLKQSTKQINKSNKSQQEINDLLIKIELCLVKRQFKSALKYCDEIISQFKINGHGHNNYKSIYDDASNLQTYLQSIDEVKKIKKD